MPGRLVDRQLGVLLALTGVLLISLDSLWIRLSGAGTWDVAFWVGAFTFVTLSIVMPLRTGASMVAMVRKHRTPLLVSAALNLCSVTLFILAIGLTAIANTVAIVAVAPVAAAVMARLVLGERPSPRTWRAIGGAVVGIVVIVAGSIRAGSVTGDLVAILAVLAFAGNVSLWRRYPDISRMAVIGLGGLFTAIISFAPADPFTLPGAAIAILAIMGVLTGPVGRVSLATSTRHLTAAQVGLFTPIETVAAICWAWLFLAEAPGSATAIGGLIVIGAVIYGSSSRAREAPRHEPIVVTDDP